MAPCNVGIPYILKMESYPPGNGYISHQTGKPDNHRLKMPFFGGYVNSLEGNPGGLCYLGWGR